MKNHWHLVSVVALLLLGCGAKNSEQQPTVTPRPYCVAAQDRMDRAFAQPHRCAVMWRVAALECSCNWESLQVGTCRITGRPMVQCFDTSTPPALQETTDEISCTSVWYVATRLGMCVPDLAVRPYTFSAGAELEFHSLAEFIGWEADRIRCGMVSRRVRPTDHACEHASPSEENAL